MAGYAHGSNLSAKRATPLLVFIFLTILFVPLTACLCAIAASALAAGVVSNAPDTTAKLTGPILCPANTASTKLVIIYGGYSTSNTNSYAHYTTRDDTNVLKCYDAQGSELAGNGDSFTALWWGSWMGSAALLGGLACFGLALLIFARVRGGQAPAGEGASTNATTRGDNIRDEELEELQRLEQADKNTKKQKKG